MQHQQRQSRGIGPIGLSGQEPEGGGPTRRVIFNITDVVMTDVRELVILDRDEPIDPRELRTHNIFEQFAEDNSSAPPAATTFIENLPSVVISTSHETNGGVICPVCKEQMPAEATATQLPCMHLYHSSCILPWLGSRNTCPVCRYELPTDDPEYGMSKRAVTNAGNVQGVEHGDLLEIAGEISDEPGVEGARYMTSGRE